MRIVHAEDLLRRDRVQVRNARVVGRLDLTDAKLAHPVVLHDCYVEEEIVLRRADVPRVDLSGCHLWGLDASQLRTRDDVGLRLVTTTGRRISLAHAHIGGSLVLDGARLSNLDGWTLNAAGMVVEQNLLARDGFTSKGELALAGAHVKGAAKLAGARLFNPGRVALAGGRLRVDQTLDCRDLVGTGRVALDGGRVGGNLSFAHARLANGTGDALAADGLTVTGEADFTSLVARGAVRLVSADVAGGLVLSHAQLNGLRAGRLVVGQRMDCVRMTSQGEVTLEAAHVKGGLNLMDARLSNIGDDALYANNITVGQDLFCNGVEVVGRFSVASGRVGGNLNLSRARLTNPGRSAVFADDLSVEGATFCFDATVIGGLWFSGARMSWLGLNGTKISNEDGFAFRARRARVDGDLVAVDLVAEGEVTLLDAAVGGLDFRDATLGTVDLEGLRAAKLVLLPRRAPDRVDLTNAKVGRFEDDPATWPETLRLRGFHYDVLEHDGAPVRRRVRWLRRHDGGYTPGLYDNLAAAYRRAGHVERARWVAIAKQWHRRGVLNPLGKAWNWLLYLTVGYGYRTSLALLWLLALLAAGTVVFAGGSFEKATPTASQFQPFVYALDVLLPVVDLGQQKDWVPRGDAQWWSWGLTAAGWILTTAVVAGLTNALKRD